MKRFCLLPALLCQISLAQVIWDGGGDGTTWEDPANWDGDVLPVESDDVVIDDPADPIITVANSLTLRSLNCEEEIIFGGNLSLTGGTSNIKNTTFNERRITVTGGAVAQFPALTALAHSANRDAIMTAEGAGSRLVFPAVLTITGSGGISDDFFFRALNGGRLEFPAATEAVSGAMTFIADGEDSLIDLPALTSFSGNLFTTSSGLRAINGGTINTPALVAFNQGELTAEAPGAIGLAAVESITGYGPVSLTGGVHDLSALTTFSANFQISGGSVPLLPNLATLEDASISLTDGAVLSLPLITEISHGENRDNTLSVDGNGSALTFPNVTTITGPTGISDELFLRATEGGTLGFPAVTTIPSGAVLITSEGADSLVDLTNLETFSGKLFTTTSGFRALQGGSILTPSLTSVTQGEITVDTPGQMDFGLLQTIAGNGMVTLTGGVHDLSALTTLQARMTITGGSEPILSNLTTLENASLFLNEGAVLSLPLVTSISHLANEDNTLSANGVGTLLSFPNLNTIVGPTGTSDELFFRTTNGGRIDCSNAIEVTSGAVLFTADGPDSTIDLTSLATFSGNLFTTTSGFRATDGGRIITPVLTSVNEGDFESDSPAGLDYAQLESFTGGGVMELSGGEFAFPVLTTYSGRTLATGGTVLTFPEVTTIRHDTGGDRFLTAEGPGSRLVFPHATSIVGSQGTGRDLFIRALNGGRVDLPGVTEVTSGAVLFVSEGPDSLIELPFLETFTGKLFTTSSGFRALNGGAIRTPALTSLHSGELTCDQAGNLDLSLLTSFTDDGNLTLTGGVHDLSALTVMQGSLFVSGTEVPVLSSLSDIDGASLYVSGGATLRLPLVTSYHQNDNNQNFFRAEGANSRLLLPNLTLLRNTTRHNFSVQAWDGGTVDLSAVEALDNPTTNSARLQFEADGIDSLVDLANLPEIEPTDARFTESNEGEIFIPGLNASNLPDLEVTSLTSSTTNLAPGVEVDLTWTIANSGGVEFNGTRRDAIFIADNPDGTNKVRLRNFNLDSILVPGASESITRTVTMPATGFNGTVHLLVVTDEGLAVVEPDESNNQGGTEALSLAATLTLQINRDEINERNDGAAQGSLSRNGSASNPLTVSLSAAPGGQVNIPATLTFESGQNTRSFAIIPIDDQLPDGDTTVTITAQADGFETGQDSLLVLDGSVPALSLSVDDSSPTEGDTVTLTITRNKPDGALAVHLSASLANQADFATPVTFADGESSLTTTVTLLDDDLAELDSLVRVIASAPGYLGDSVDLSLIDDDRPNLTLTLNNSLVSEAAGPGQLLATVTRETATSEAVLINLVASTQSAFEPIGSTFIPANLTTVTIPLTPVDNSNVEGTRTVTLWARSIEANSGQLLAESPTVPLDLTDDDGPALTLTAASPLVLEGDLTTLTVTRNVVTGDPLTVTFTHDGDDRIDLPPSTTLLPNEASAQVVLTLNDNGEVDGTGALEVIASADGFASGSRSLTLSDESRPELVVSRLDGIPEVNTNESGSFSYRISNLGSRQTTSSITIQTFLSRDQTISESDVLIDNYLFEGEIPAGLYFERSGSFIAPIEGGTYFLISRVDPAGLIPEIVESNNTTVSEAVEIVTAYTTTVSTSVTVQPSGTPVPLTGSATRLDGTPAAFELVNLHLNLRGTERIISALTDSGGNFATTFNPLPGEAGTYTIGATHPGNPEADPQDSFTLLGFQTDPRRLAVKLTADGIATTGSFELTNLADLNQSGLSFTLVGAPAGVSGSFTPASGSSLASLASTEVDYSLSADPGLAAGSYDAALRIESSEGGIRQLGLDLTVCLNTPELSVSNLPLKRGMVAGQQTFVNFRVRNTGGAPTGPWQVILPDVPWLSSAVASPLPSLAPDEQITISLQLGPADDLPLGEYPGSLLLRAADSSLSVPFSFRNLSLAKGNLTVICEDEYTYFAEGRPKLAGAHIEVIDNLTRTTVAEAVGDANGEATFDDLNEGYYEVIVTAEKHASYRGIVFVEPGEDNQLTAFLERTSVEYIWTVVPTTIEDEYRIVIETVFETNVPLPVVTVEPAHIDLSTLTEEVTHVDLTITNHGLIAVEDVGASFTSTSEWSMTSIAEDLGDLPAKSSITVPITITNLNFDAPRTSARAGGCPGARIEWGYECGTYVIKRFSGVSTGGGGCGGSGNGAVFPVGGVGGGGGIVPRPSGSNSPCDECLAKAIRDCAISFVPGADIPLCIYGAATANNLIDAAQAGLSCACAVADLTVVAGAACNLINCYIDILQCSSGDGGGEGRAAVRGTPTFLAFDAAGRDLMTFLDYQMVTYGDPAWTPYLASPELGTLAMVLLPALEEGSESGGLVSPSERAEALATPLGASETALVTALIDRLNRTKNYYDSGIFEIEDLSPGMNEDFITRSAVQTTAAAYVDAVDRARAAGYEGLIEAYLAKQGDLLNFLTVGDGVCAKVRLRIEQDAVMTRDAFEASLEILNNDDLPMEGLDVNISIVDPLGADQTALFGIDGEGSTNATLPGNTTENWSWTIIPTSLAAPEGPVEYLVKGSVSFRQGGVRVETPLAPQPITVQPNPILKLKYFHQRDVFSDDPDTEIVEPSIPFSLGVMIQNEGAGLARNLRITSAQPVIVENEKGLFIDFDIIASEVSGQSLTPSLTADFGDLRPGEIKVGRWLMKSSLQGLFTEYEASFEHVNALNDERLSLIQEVTIHETIRAVEAQGPLADGLPDFLVNDLFDLGDFPDTVHLSDGSTEPVTVVSSGTSTSPTPLQLQVPLTIASPSGFLYARLDDPGEGNYRLVRVERSDGRVLPLDTNAWTTDRTFLGLGSKPLRENKLHLFDHDTTGSYTLTYALIPPPDTEAPTSSVAALPADAPGFFSVDWSGTDNTGITSFDIFVSENGSPFTLWLENTGDTSALYQGTFGNDYAFYSLASDAAGNTEPAKTSGEATTTISLANQAPVFTALPDVTLTEGQSLNLRATATDPDGPDSALRFQLSTDEPGITINPTTGRLRWNTTETDGGRLVPVTLSVTDGDSSPATSSLTFNVNVLDDNKRPVLDPFPTLIVEIDEAIRLNADGSDPDFPLQPLTYSLGAGAPSGMTLDPATGELAWTPGEADGGKSYAITVEVSDGQDPPLTTSQTLLVEVLEDPGLPPVFDPVPAQIWPAFSTRFLDLRARDPEGEPVTLRADFSGLPGLWLLEDLAQPGEARLHWHTIDAAPGLYLIPVTAATDRQSTTALITIEVEALPSFDDFSSWAEAYQIPPERRSPEALVPGVGLPNALAYALGIDPVNGISPAQPDPGRVVIPDAESSALSFQLPDGGRPELRYLVQTTTDFLTWETIGVKEGQQPWSDGSVVIEEVISPSRSLVQVVKDRGRNDNRFRSFRLIVQSLND